MPLLEFEDNIAAIIAHLQDFFLHVVVMSPPPVHVSTRYRSILVAATPPPAPSAAPP